MTVDLPTDLRRMATLVPTSDAGVAMSKAADRIEALEAEATANLAIENEIAVRMPEQYDGDEAQIALIGKYIRDLEALVAARNAAIAEALACIRESDQGDSLSGAAWATDPRTPSAAVRRVAPDRETLAKVLAELDLGFAHMAPAPALLYADALLASGVLGEVRP